jgi:hypothetical protein
MTILCPAFVIRERPPADGPRVDAVEHLLMAAVQFLQVLARALAFEYPRAAIHASCEDAAAFQTVSACASPRRFYQRKCEVASGEVDVRLL